MNINDQWLDAAREVIRHGREVEPRGKRTYELPQYTVRVDMRWPVLTIEERLLSYQFMAAEAYWILTGDKHVSTIAPYNRHISQFSDDGETFAGAYGPRIMEQLDYIVNKLIEDPDSRQAGLTIWRPNPEPSKDIPCTVAIWLQVRDKRLHTHVFMRSSDIWLGLPYDLFNFSMLAHLVCCRLRTSLMHQDLQPGSLYLTAASLHLYEEHRPKLQEIVNCTIGGYDQNPTPEALYQDEYTLINTLKELRNSKVGNKLRWWV